MTKLRYTTPVWVLRRFVSRHEGLYRLASALRGNSQLARGGEDLVMDGFPRSANSWAEAAFLVAQAGRGPLRIAHHCHAAAQLLAGARLGLPTLVLVRAPADAVLSYREMLDVPVPFAQLFADYVALYQPLLARQDRLCFAGFDDIVNDFGSVIRRLNRTFSTDFAVPTHDAAFVGQVRAEMDRISILRTGQPTRYSGARGAEFARTRDERRRVLQAELKAALGSAPARAAAALYESLKPLIATKA
jgi:hypothetical protein